MEKDLLDIKSLIYEVRGNQVMLDEDLAKIYQVETKVFNQTIKRNLNRFPPEFMFQLTEEEYTSLRSQFVTSKSGRGGQIGFGVNEKRPEYSTGVRTGKKT